MLLGRFAEAGRCGGSASGGRHAEEECVGDDAHLCCDQRMRSLLEKNEEKG